MTKNQTKAREIQKQKEEQEKSTKQNGTASPDQDKIALIDTLSLELGYALIPLVDKEKGSELLERITRIRSEAKRDIGIIVPKIHIQDNMTLPPNEYSFKIKGIEAGHAEVRLGYYMCMDNGGVINPIKGEKTKDPAFGMDAIWLPEDQRQEAENAGYTIIDPPTLMATHITELIRANAAKLLGRQEVSQIIENVKEKYPVLVTEVLETAHLSYGHIQRVLQNLLEEGVSIRDIVTILETLSNYAKISDDPRVLTEKVREALGLQICLNYVDKDEKKLHVIQMSEEFCQLLQDNAQYPPDGSRPLVGLDPVDRRKFLRAVSDALARVTEKGFQPIILCNQAARPLVKVATERDMPGIVAISDMEVIKAGNQISIEVIDKIEEKEEVL